MSSHSRALLTACELGTSRSTPTVKCPPKQLVTAGRAWRSLTTTSDHNEVGRRPTKVDWGEADPQVSDGNRHRAGSLQARDHLHQMVQQPAARQSEGDQH